MRALDEIDAEIAATARHLTNLAAERRRTTAARKAAILADFDAGMARREICARHGILFSSLGSLLWKSGRSAATQAMAGLSPAEQAIYRQARRAGAKTRTARRMAQALGRGAPSARGAPVASA